MQIKHHPAQQEDTKQKTWIKTKIKIAAADIKTKIVKVTKRAVEVVDMTRREKEAGVEAEAEIDIIVRATEIETELWIVIPEEEREESRDCNFEAIRAFR